MLDALPPTPKFRGRPRSLAKVGDLGRVQLSRYFFMRQFLYSEIAAVHGLNNYPTNPDLAIKTGRRLAQDILDPLVETFGPIEIRSAYRSPEVNAFGNAGKLGCASNEKNFGKHIWDHPDAAGNIGASVSIVIPWFVRQWEAGRDWRDLAWWLHDHLQFHAACFFPKRAAFNIGWRTNAVPSIYSYARPTGRLVRPTEPPALTASERSEKYKDFPPFRGISLPI